MLAKIVEFSIRHRLVVILASMAMIAAGLYSAVTLPIDAVPDVTTTQIVVNAAAPALGPPEVERQITQPLELELSGIPGAVEMRSVSQFGLCQITVEFADGTDLYRARQLVAERLKQVESEIPSGVEPEMAPIATGLGEIYYVFVEGEGLSLMERREILDWQVKPRLRSVPGVIEVNSYGGHVKQYQVLADPVRMKAHGITFERLFDALESNNRNAGGAYILKEDEQQLVQGLGLVESLDDLRNIVLATSNGASVLVQHVADVGFGPALRQGTITKDGKGEAVAAIAVMLMGENSRAVTQRVKERVEEIQTQMPKGVRLVGFLDRTELVDNTLRTAGDNLWHGGVLVVLILFLFLLQFRAGLIVSSAIPLAMLMAIIAMKAFGVSANLMSLGAIDFGLIVDAAVIIVENCVRRLAALRRELGRELTEGERLATIKDGTLEVRQASQYGELVIIAAYLPILTLVGIEGKMFRPMGLTVVFALVGALLLSMTLIPALCAYFLRAKDERENPVVDWLQRRYEPIVHWTIRRRGWVVAAAVLLCVAAGSLFTRLGSEFLPKLDEGAITINPSYLPGISIDTAIKRASLVERVLLAKFPDEIESAATRIGRPDVATDPMTLAQHDMHLPLKPRSQWKRARSKEDLIRKIEVVLAAIPGMKHSFTQPIELRMNEMSEGVGVRSDLGVKIFGPNMATLQQRAIAIANVMRGVKGGEDVVVEATAGLPVLQIRARRADLARYGLEVADVNRVIETAVGGARTGEVVEELGRFEIVLRIQERFRQNPAAIGRLLVEGKNGQSVPLSMVADLESIEGPAQISRENGERRIVVQANVRGRDLGGYVEEVKSKVERLVRIPPGYHLEWGGQYEHLNAGRARLAIAVPATFGIVLLLLFAAFSSIRHALLVFSGVPFAVTGGILALYLRGMHFSMSAGIGFIALFGVAVLNGLVLMSFINQLVREGAPITAAVIQGSLSRLRPVLMTATVASIGFLPMALSTGTGAEVQKPLATVVIGGLITSTLLTLVVLPSLAVLFAGRTNGPLSTQSRFPEETKEKQQ